MHQWTEMRVEVCIYISSKEVFCMWIWSNVLKEELSWWRKWMSFFCEHWPKTPTLNKSIGLGHNSTIVWCISTILMPWMRIAGIQQQLYHKPLSQNKNNWHYDNGNGNKVVFSCTPPVSFQHTIPLAHSQDLIHKHQSMFSTCCS